MKIFLCVIASVIFTICFAAPLQEEQRYRLLEDDPELTAGFFEGDMILDNERNGRINESYRWPDNTVLYYINDHFDDAHINHILKGMRNIEAISCIRFKAVTPDQPYYVNITGNPGGCSSSVGFLNRVQTYNLQIADLDTGCFRMGTIMHEFLHTLGFHHMQSTHNRDDYVQIVEKNIQAGSTHNFNLYTEDLVENFDEEYDYNSILHYSAYAFSVNGEKTIVALNPEKAIDMGQRRALTNSDINKLNVMYRCPHVA